MLIQSKGYWRNIAKSLDQVTQITSELYRVHLGNAEILVIVFAHPSTPDNAHNWGRDATYGCCQSFSESENSG